MPLSESPTCRVFDVQRFSIHDGPGIRTTVFLEGCPLRCAWCQNPEAFRCGVAPALSPEAIIAEVERDRAYYERSGGGLTLSGGEPLLHATAVRALLEAAKRADLHTCVQTCGAVPQVNIEVVLGLVDLFQFDLKHFDPQRHQELTGARLDRIHSNAAFLLERGATVEFRMPIVPGINDDPENLDQLGRFLAAHTLRTIHLLGYHTLYLDKYQTLGLPLRLAGIPPASPDDLDRAARQLSSHALTVVLDG